MNSEPSFMAGHTLAPKTASARRIVNVLAFSTPFMIGL